MVGYPHGQAVFVLGGLVSMMVFRLLGTMLHSLNLETNEIVIQKTSEIDLDVQNFERSNPNECFGTQTFKLERAGHQINGHAKG